MTIDKIVEFGVISPDEASALRKRAIERLAGILKEKSSYRYEKRPIQDALTREVERIDGDIDIPAHLEDAKDNLCTRIDGEGAVNVFDCIAGLLLDEEGDGEYFERLDEAVKKLVMDY